MAKEVVLQQWVHGNHGRYTVTIYKDGSAYCTCPGWRFGRVDAQKRTCKHTRALSAGMAVA